MDVAIRIIGGLATTWVAFTAILMLVACKRWPIWLETYIGSVNDTRSKVQKFWQTFYALSGLLGFAAAGYVCAMATLWWVPLSLGSNQGGMYGRLSELLGVVAAIFSGVWMYFLVRRVAKFEAEFERKRAR